MEVSDVALLIALVCGLLLNLPQLWQTYKTREVASFSTTTIVLRVMVSVCWIVYAGLQNVPLILASSGVNFVSEATLLLMKQCYK